MRRSRWDEWADPLVAAESRRPMLIPLFPVGEFTPQSRCPHTGPLRRGSVFCCMVCHQSGLDNHPAVRYLPKDFIAPDKTPRQASKGRQTRRKRRDAASKGVGS